MWGMGHGREGKNRPHFCGNRLVGGNGSRGGKKLTNDQETRMSLVTGKKGTCQEPKNPVLGVGVQKKTGEEEDEETGKRFLYLGKDLSADTRTRQKKEEKHDPDTGGDRYDFLMGQICGPVELDRFRYFRKERGRRCPACPRKVQHFLRPTAQLLPHYQSQEGGGGIACVELSSAKVVLVEKRPRRL